MVLKKWSQAARTWMPEVWITNYFLAEIMFIFVIGAGTTYFDKNSLDHTHFFYESARIEEICG